MDLGPKKVVSLEVLEIFDFEERIELAKVFAALLLAGT